MNSNLPMKKSDGKSESEQFVLAGRPLDFDLLNFWKWAASDLVDNTWRGVLAEYVAIQSTDPMGCWRLTHVRRVASSSSNSG